MLYKMHYTCCGEVVKDVILEGPEVDNLQEIIDIYEDQWVSYVDDIRDEVRDNECEVEERCLKKIKKSFPVDKYIRFEDYEDFHAFALNMLLNKWAFKQLKCKEVKIRW